MSEPTTVTGRSAKVIAEEIMHVLPDDRYWSLTILTILLVRISLEVGFEQHDVQRLTAETFRKLREDGDVNWDMMQ